MPNQNIHSLNPSVRPEQPDGQGQTNATPQETKVALQHAIDDSSQVLLEVHAVPLLDLFPDSMTIDRSKITIVKRSFFRVAEIMSTRVEDVLNVTCTVGPFFGSVGVVSRIMGTEQITTVGKFWRSDAKRLKRIAQGYVIARQQNIDCSPLSTKELADMLEELGQDNHQAA